MKIFEVLSASKTLILIIVPVEEEADAKVEEKKT